MSRSYKERLEEVRDRMITDFYTGASANSLHYWVCRVCSWTWENGKPELHEPTCPLER